MRLGFRYAVRSDLGTVRTNNEDSAYAAPSLLVLADGMGGHAGGEVASVVALRRFSHIDTEADVAEQILAAGRSTRTALQAMSDADADLESMGTTVVTVAAGPEAITVGHIGDSRLYALRGDALYQVTRDHTHVQRLVDTGQLSPERARTHPYRAMLLRSLDDQPGGTDLDLIDLEVAAGDRLLICSDGLSDYLTPEQIGQLLSGGTIDEAADGLVEGALTVGTRDNVTVIVADVVAANDSGDARPALAGAVADGIGLSAEAREALESTLPGLPTGPEGADLSAWNPDFSADPAAPEVEPAAETLDEQDRVAVVADPAAPGDELEGAVAPLADPVPVSGGLVDPATDLDAPAPAAATPDAITPSEAPAFPWPGVLAGAGLLLVAVAIWLLLHG